MANLSFNSSLSLDLGLSGISYQARESVQESPALREIAPLEEAARNNLEVLLAKPNLASFITAHLRPDIADNDALTPVRFNRGCNAPAPIWQPAAGRQRDRRDGAARTAHPERRDPPAGSGGHVPQRAAAGMNAPAMLSDESRELISLLAFIYLENNRPERATALLHALEAVKASDNRTAARWRWPSCAAAKPRPRWPRWTRWP